MCSILFKKRGVTGNAYTQTLTWFAAMPAEMQTFTFSNALAVVLTSNRFPKRCFSATGF